MTVRVGDTVKITVSVDVLGSELFHDRQRAISEAARSAYDMTVDHLDVITVTDDDGGHW